MLIRQEDINMVTMCLEAAQAMNRLWMAFDENRRSLTPKGLHFFEFKREATAYCKEWQRYFTDYKVVPVPRLLEIIKSIKELQRHDELQAFKVQINSKALAESNKNQIKMQREHVISDEVLSLAQMAFSKGEYWIAYNTVPYFLEKGDMHFFRNSDEAHEFSDNNISEYDDFKVVYACSADELLKRIPYGEKLEQQLSNKKKLLIMNEKNLKALKDNLKYLGFGEGLNEQLEMNIREQKQEFTLPHEVEYNNQKLVSELSFKAGDQNEMYFFNKYTAKLNEPDDRQQTFYLDRGNGVTTKEAFNLLQGRAVNKDLVNRDGEKYNAWVQLDFSIKEESGNYKMDRYHENYKYNLEEAISKYPLKELEDSKWKEDLIKSLEKGNIQAVKMEIGNKDELMYITANPKDKMINIYDKATNPLNESARKELERKPSPARSEQQEVANETSQENKKGQKQKNDPAGGDDDDGPELKKKRTRKKGLGV